MKTKLLVLSNVTSDLISAKINKDFDVYLPNGYDGWINCILDKSSILYTEKYDSIIVLLSAMDSRCWKNEVDAQNRITIWQQAIEVLCSTVHDSYIFLPIIDLLENPISALSQISPYYQIEQSWIEFVKKLSENHKNVSIYNFKKSVIEVGRKNFYSSKMWHYGGMPFSLSGIQRIVNDIYLLQKSTQNTVRKVLALDLDNTIWGGVIGEDGIDGIRLADHGEGMAYYEFQKMLLEMKKRGVLLAINSKNNISDVEYAFQNHPNMILKLSDFVAVRANWDSKANNIKSIAKELNLSEAAFVFVDDNPIEREIIKGDCPEVYVPDFPNDTSNLVDFAEAIYQNCFRQILLLPEDNNKTEMYLAEKKRKDEKKLCSDLDDYIRKLDIEITIRNSLDTDIDRLTQLFNKTNQFNVTTKRYTRQDISRMIDEKDCFVYSIFAKDKFGDSGLISSIIVKTCNDSAYIDSFLMSCRVMGRKIENVIIDSIIKSLTDLNYKTLFAEFILTAKNKPVEYLFEQMNFDVISQDSERKEYMMHLGQIKSTVNGAIFEKIILNGEVLNEN